MSTRLPRKSGRGLKRIAFTSLLNLLSKRIRSGAGPLDIISHFDEAWINGLLTTNQEWRYGERGAGYPKIRCALKTAVNGLLVDFGRPEDFEMVR